MDTLSKHLSSYRPKRNRFGSEQFTIAPIPREELPDEMRSVLESVRADCHPSDLLDRYPDHFSLVSSSRLSDLPSLTFG